MSERTSPKIGKGEKGEASFRRMFVLISILLFAFFILDLSLSYVPVYNTLTGHFTFQPVIKFIPLLG